MHPTLLWIGDYEVRTYTLLALLAMLGALAVVRSEARRLGWNTRGASWLTLQATGVGFVGAHLLYAITRLGLPWHDWWRVLFRFGYGGVWFGGFLLSWLWCRRYALRNRIPPLQMYDVAALAALIANAVGRVGCFFNGCCFGTPTDLPWGVLLDTRDFGHEYLHPVPIYEMLYLLSLFAVFWRLRKKNARDGQTAARYLIFMPLGRFLLEFLRGDSIRGFVIGWLSTSQFIAASLVLSGLILYRKTAR